MQGGTLAVPPRATEGNSFATRHHNAFGRTASVLPYGPSIAATLRTAPSIPL